MSGDIHGYAKCRKHDPFCGARFTAVYDDGAGLIRILSNEKGCLEIPPETIFNERLTYPLPPYLNPPQSSAIKLSHWRWDNGRRPRHFLSPIRARRLAAVCRTILDAPLTSLTPEILGDSDVALPV